MTPQETGKDTILAVANHYDTAAAAAYRARNDNQAAELRDAADRLREVVKTLPPLPGRTTR